jgi:SAM-dependent methyltransferase
MSTYTLTLSEREVERYRWMAAEARRSEEAAWRAAGIVPGARVADVGCGPAAVLVELARLVGPGGHGDGVERDVAARAAAHQMVTAAGLGNARIVEGDAAATGLEAGQYDVVMLRHVLIHNGAQAPAIVAHLATLLRPGGCLFVVDADAAGVQLDPADPDLEDLNQRFLRLLEQQGADLYQGVHLGALLHEAGLARGGAGGCGGRGALGRGVHAMGSRRAAMCPVRAEVPRRGSARRRPHSRSDTILKTAGSPRYGNTLEELGCGRTLTRSGRRSTTPHRRHATSRHDAMKKKAGHAAICRGRLRQ